MERRRSRKEVKASEVFVASLVYAAVGAAVAWYFYYFRRRELIGGFWVAMILATVGAVLFTTLASIKSWFANLVYWLMLPKYEETLLAPVNLITALIGAVLFVYILNRINHDRERRG